MVFFLHSVSIVVGFVLSSYLSGAVGQEFQHPEANAIARTLQSALQIGDARNPRLMVLHQFRIKIGKSGT